MSEGIISVGLEELLQSYTEARHQKWPDQGWDNLILKILTERTQKFNPSDENYRRRLPDHVCFELARPAKHEPFVFQLGPEWNEVWPGIYLERASITTNSLLVLSRLSAIAVSDHPEFGGHPAEKEFSWCLVEMVAWFAFKRNLHTGKQFEITEGNGSITVWVFYDRDFPTRFSLAFLKEA